MNLPGVLMGIAAGIGIHATLTHGLVGFGRRPRDMARITFAGAALAATVGALAVLAMYSADTLGTYVAVTKWVFFPASVGWTVCTVWFVAFYADVRPRAFLAALSLGFLAVVVLDLVMPMGLLHDGRGRLVTTHVLGGSIMVPVGSAPHVLHHATDILTLFAFLFMCYAVYRVYRGKIQSKARYLGAMTVLLALATLADTVNEHSVVTTFTTLYLTQLCFAAVIVAMSLALRRESLRLETELTMYRTRMDALVAERVRDLDEANALLAQEAKERRATEEVLLRRVEELDALQRVSRILSWRSSLDEAVDEATTAIARLFKARYARVRVAAGEEPAEVASGRGGAGEPQEDHERRLSPLDLVVAERAEHDGVLIAADAGEWPGLEEDLRRAAEADGLGPVLAAPLLATSRTAGALVVARDAGASPFTAEEQQLARTISEGLAAVIEIDRLHRSETRQAAAEEREALARDLHDAVTQSIYSATLIAEALPAVYRRNPEEGLQNLERLRRLVRAALAEMRTLLFELRPAALETAPLDGLLERLADALAGQADITVNLEADVWPDLPDDVKTVLYRVTQEAFSNVAKHARAGEVTVRLSAGDDGVTLTIRDDGRGFDPAVVPSGHMGLTIMRERLERVGARFSLETAPGAGTTISAFWRKPASEQAVLETMGA